MMKLLKSFSIAALCLAVLALTHGCGKKTGPTGTVQGKVTLDGAPYTDAAVVFLGVDSGQASSANIQADGSFQLPDSLPVGKYVVYLAPKTQEGSAADEPTPVSMDQSVPEKYWNEASSDIKVEIQEGPNEIPVELKR